MSSSNPIETSASLLIRLRDANDRSSWETFVSVYGPLIGGFCRSQGLQEADAADVSQEVLVRVMKAISTFEYQPERGRFRDWLGAVVRNAVRRFRSQSQKKAREIGSDRLDLEMMSVESPDPEWVSHYHSRLLRAACDRIRSQFEPHTWQAFERVWFDQMPALAAAEELGLPIHSVYVAKSRILQHLREELIFLSEDMPNALP